MKKYIQYLVLFASVVLASSAFAVNFGMFGTAVGVANPTDQFSGEYVYSIGTTATELGGASFQAGEITVASNIATFSVAWQAANPSIGVGDVVEYDVDNDASLEAGEWGIIRGISTDRKKAYLLKGTATSVTNTSASTGVFNVFRAYTSLANTNSNTINSNLDDALEAEVDLADKDITGEGAAYFAAYADGNLATSAFSAWTTDSDDFINIFVPYDTAHVGTTQRHQGVYSTSYAYASTAADEEVFEAGTIGASGFLYVEGLQFNCTGAIGTNRGCVYFKEAGSKFVDAIIVKDDSTANPNISSGIWLDDTADLVVKNSIVYNTDGNGEAGGNGMYTKGTASGDFTAYNNTVYGFNDCFEHDGSGTFVVTNNIAFTCADVDDDFDGTFTKTTNACDEVGDCSMTGLIWDNELVTIGSDFHVEATSGNIKDGGTDLSGSGVTKDVDGESRDASYDIGADEYV